MSRDDHISICFWHEFRYTTLVLSATAVTIFSMRPRINYSIILRLDDARLQKIVHRSPDQNISRLAIPHEELPRVLENVLTPKCRPFLEPTGTLEYRLDLRRASHLCAFLRLPFDTERNCKVKRTQGDIS